jgi:hypothetical protein
VRKGLLTPNPKALLRVACRAQTGVATALNPRNAPNLKPAGCILTLFLI